jgi:hypothetical protein
MELNEDRVQEQTVVCASERYDSYLFAQIKNNLRIL